MAMAGAGTSAYPCYYKPRLYFVLRQDQRGVIVENYEWPDTCFQYSRNNHVVYGFNRGTFYGDSYRYYLLMAETGCGFVKWSSSYSATSILFSASSQPIRIDSGAIK